MFDEEKFFEAEFSYEALGGDEAFIKFLEERGYPRPKLIKMKEEYLGKIKTADSTFRARAEKQAREYRVGYLGVTKSSKFGHIFDEADGRRGLNFLPSYRNEILSEVQRRAQQGKGVLLERTLNNMLSSQALCFNLFIPLSLNKELFAKVFNKFLGNVKSINDEFEIEYTPDTEIFNDQSGIGGVDCDALFTYQTIDNKKVLVTVETKYVEPEFSICGFRRSTQDDKCPLGTVVNPTGSNCRYSYKKNYYYWRRTIENKLFQVNSLFNNTCPFGSTLWQLWTNINLAASIESKHKMDDFRFVVICPKKNVKLTNNEKVFDEFKKLLIDESKFIVIYLEDLIEELKNQILDNNSTWIKEFDAKYSLKK